MKTKWQQWQRTLFCAGTAWAMTGISAWAATPLWPDANPVEYVGPPVTATSWGTRAVGGGTPRTTSNPITIYILDLGVGKHQSFSSDPVRYPFQHASAPEIINFGIGCYPHATHVAGIIGADIGLKGVYPGAKIVSVSANAKALDGRNCDGNIVSNGHSVGIRKIKELIQSSGKVGIVNISANPTLSMLSHETIRDLAKPDPQTGYPGAFVVQSAGNHYSDVCTNNLAYKPAGGLPLTDDGIMVTGALDNNGQPAMKYSFYMEDGKITTMPLILGSNYGQCVEIWAPGHEIYSAWSNNTQSDSDQDSATIQRGYRKLSGTSMAAPHVAAIAAYLADTQKLTTPAAIEKAVRDVMVDVNGAQDAGGNSIRMPKLTDRIAIRAIPSVLFRFTLNPQLSGPPSIVGTNISYRASDQVTFGLAYDVAGANSCSLEKKRPNAQNWESVSSSTFNIKESSYSLNNGAAITLNKNNPGEAGTTQWKVRCSSGNGFQEALAAVTVEGTSISKPVCTVPSSISIPSGGGSYSVPATCTNSPTSYSWTVNGVPIAAGATLGPYYFPANTSTSPVVYNITMTATNSGGTSNPVSTTATQAGSPLPKPVCTVPSSISIPYTGGSYSVPATCTNSPTSYSWTVNGVPIAAGATLGPYYFPANTSTSPVVYNITMTATNSGGTSNPVSTRATQAGKPATPPSVSVYINGSNMTNRATSIRINTPFTFSYSATNATSCTMNLSLNGSTLSYQTGLPISATYYNNIFTVKGTYTETMTCVNAQGQSGSAYVNVVIY